MTPDTQQLADFLQDLASQYANANQGSATHVLGEAEIGNMTDFIPHLKDVPSVKGGFAIRFKDGTLYLLNVHLMPAQSPSNQTPPDASNASG